MKKNKKKKQDQAYSHHPELLIIWYRSLQTSLFVGVNVYIPTHMHVC